jgi:Zn-finger nucleic acid-binding protein
MEPTTLTCAKCGGPLPAAAADQVVTCPFCGVVSKPAPAVVTVERVVAVKGEGAGGPSCPRCAATLHESVVGKHRVIGCGGCGGLWLEHPTVEYLSTHNDADLANAVQHRAGIVFRRMDCSALLTCPFCNVAMARHSVEAPGYTTYVDVCKVHGTWFDSGELRQFVTIFAERRANDPGDEVPTKIPEEGFFTDLFGSIRALF